jgi:sulfur-oxidizing protein SoxY
MTSKAFLVTRRDLVAATVATTGFVALPSLLHAAEALQSVKPASDLFVLARDQLAGGRVIQAGRVHLDLPRLAENGNSVTLKVAVDSPMTATDHVRTIHLLSEQNPVATLAKFHVTPRAGRAWISTSIRLAGTQYVHAIAELSDGSLWFAKARSDVLLAACIDGG